MAFNKRLDTLLDLHRFQGGTIHQYNKAYNKDFINMSNEDWKQWLVWVYNNPHTLVIKRQELMRNIYGI